jgi:hypothetical protein
MGYREELDEIERQEKAVLHKKLALQLAAAEAAKKDAKGGSGKTPDAKPDDETSHRGDEDEKDAKESTLAAKMIGEVVKQANRPGLDLAKVKYVTGFPEWCSVPEGLNLPKYALAVPMRIFAALTSRPDKGDRTCICWQLSDGDDRLAIESAMSDPMRYRRELTKRMIRAVDGHLPSDDPNSPGCVDRWWDEIGPKGRHQINLMYNVLHTTTAAEQASFFESCVAFVVPR